MRTRNDERYCGMCSDVKETIRELVLTPAEQQFNNFLEIHDLPELTEDLNHVFSLALFNNQDDIGEYDKSALFSQKLVIEFFREIAKELKDWIFRTILPPPQSDYK